MTQSMINCPYCNKEITLIQDETNDTILENDLSEKDMEVKLETMGIYLGVVEKGGE